MVRWYAAIHGRSLGADEKASGTSPSQDSERAIHWLAVYDRGNGTGSEQLFWRDCHDVGRQDDKVCQLPGRDRAQDVFGEGGVRRIERHA